MRSQNIIYPPTASIVSLNLTTRTVANLTQRKVKPCMNEIKNHDSTVQRIFGLINEKSLSQKEFAFRVGVTPKTVSEWKTFSTSFYEYITLIAEVLDTTISYLIDGDETKKDGAKVRKITGELQQKLDELELDIGAVNDKYQGAGGKGNPFDRELYQRLLLRECKEKLKEGCNSISLT